MPEVPCLTRGVDVFNSVGNLKKSLVTWTWFEVIVEIVSSQDSSRIDLKKNMLDSSEALTPYEILFLFMGLHKAKILQISTKNYYYLKLAIISMLRLVSMHHLELPKTLNNECIS